MISKENIDYCTCEDVLSVHTETNEQGQWDVCDKCNKPIEDSFEITDLNYLEY